MKQHEAASLSLVELQDVLDRLKAQVSREPDGPKASVVLSQLHLAAIAAGSKFKGLADRLKKATA